MAAVTIVRYDARWPDAFQEIAARMREQLGASATRIDHIGSTAVPGLDAKDVIDVQVTVAEAASLLPVTETLAAAGWRPYAGIADDHDVPGLPQGQTKRFLKEADGERRANVHVRVEGAPNQRYPLLVRDYLRARPLSAQAYAALKRELAATFADDVDRYADAKDPACDLIYLAAEDWASATGWAPAPPDA